MTDERVLTWLIEGDPAIRWQTLRDLLDRPEDEWAPERARVVTEGWGKRFLEHQDASGSWGGGIYSPKWTSTTYTLLSLIDFGIPVDHPGAAQGAALVARHTAAKGLYQTNDQCVNGFYLRILAYFGGPASTIQALSELLLQQQMDDGGWNCRRDRLPGVRHSSFHTTFNVLEGLREAKEAGHLDPSTFLVSEQRALTFMLEHRMYKSDRTGEIVNPRFTEFAYPPRWHYDVLRGLDYMRSTPYARDPRLADALELLKGHANNGMWRAQNRHAGRTFFAMEPGAGPSRWNTLRALRILRACG